jgi:hypothetical protein
MDERSGITVVRFDRPYPRYAAEEPATRITARLPVLRRNTDRQLPYSSVSNGSKSLVEAIVTGLNISGFTIERAGVEYLHPLRILDFRGAVSADSLI